MSKLQERARKLEAEIGRYKKLHAEHKNLVDGAKEEANEHATNHKLASYDRDKLREQLASIRVELKQAKEVRESENKHNILP